MTGEGLLGISPGMRVKFHKTTLPNGMRVLTEEIPEFPTVAFGIWVNVGSRDEAPKEAGLTHFIEHMLFKGTDRRSAQEIAKEMDRLGGYSNAFTSRENTCFHAKVLPEHLPDLIDLLADLFLHSRFADEDVEREKQIVLQEIKMVEDSPEELVHDLFARFIWGGHALGRPILGTWETVSQFSPEGIKDYFKRLYTGLRVVISAAGATEHQSLLNLVEKYFGHLPPGPKGGVRRPPTPCSGLEVVTKKLEQVHFVLGVPTPGAASERRYAALLFNTLLGGTMSSRLFQEIRERRGLAYAVYSYLSLYEDIGVLGIYAAVEKENLWETLLVIHQEIKALCEGRFEQGEFSAALDHLKGALLLSSDSPETRMTRIARNEILFSRYIPYEETIERLKALKPKEIESFGQEVFSKRPALVVLGPVEKKELEVKVSQILELGP